MISGLTHWHPLMWFPLKGVSEKEHRKSDLEAIFKETMPWNFEELKKDD
jgi:hypothetical protein